MAAAIAPVQTEQRNFTHSERIRALMGLFEEEYPKLCERVRTIETNIWPTALADACKYQPDELKKVVDKHIAIYLEVQAIDDEVYALTKAAQSVLKRCKDFPVLTQDNCEYLRDARAQSNRIQIHISTMKGSCITPLQSLCDIAQELRNKSLQRLGECQTSFNGSLEPVFEKLRRTLSWRQRGLRVLGSLVYFNRTLWGKIAPPPIKLPDIVQERPKIRMQDDIDGLTALSVPLTDCVNKLKTNKPD